MSKLAERLILPLAVVSIAVAVAVIFREPSAGIAVLIGGAFEARVQRERARRLRGETRLLHALRTWRLYG